jgi:hypothetical protein
MMDYNATSTFPSIITRGLEKIIEFGSIGNS